MTSSLRFEALPAVAAAALSSAARAQIEAYGERLDGEALPAEARLDAANDGAGAFYEPTWWRVVDAEGHAVFDAIFSDVDAGAIFRAGTSRLVGLVTQGGFSCTDLDAWERLAAAEAPDGFPGVDLSIDEEAGPTLRVVGSESRVELEVGSAWRALRVVVAPWDPDGVVTRLLTATSDDVLAGEVGQTGSPLAYFPAAAVERADAVLRAVPVDAVAQRRGPREAEIADEAYREAAWLEQKLRALRAIVATHAPLLVRVV